MMQEGMKFPTIVFVGPQSSGESSVVDELAGTNLPRRQGNCTQDPLILHLPVDPFLIVLLLHFEHATSEIAASGNCISGIPLTLVVPDTLAHEQQENTVSYADAVITLTQTINRAKEMVGKLLLIGEVQNAPLVEMLNGYEKELSADIPSKEGFLMKEIVILEEARLIGFPTLLSDLLNMKMKEASSLTHDFVTKVCDYMEDVILRFFEDATENCPPLQACIRRVAHNLVQKLRGNFLQAAKDIIELEKVRDHTCNREYMKMMKGFMDSSDAFMEAMHDHSKPSKICINVVGEVDVSHLRGKPEELMEETFYIKLVLISYWKCVVIGLVESLAMSLRYNVKKLLGDELLREIMKEGFGGGRNVIDRMMKESPSTAGREEGAAGEGSKEVV